MARSAVPNIAAAHFSMREKKRPFWRVLKRCIPIAAGIDILFFILFYTIGSPLLAWINIVSIAMYGAAYACLVRRKNLAALSLIWAEVLGHATLGTVMIGWDSAFHYYLLMFIPAIFVSMSTGKAVGLVLALWAAYLSLNALSYFHPPLEPLAPLPLLVLGYFNISAVFAMFAYLSWYYYHSIFAAQVRLSALATTDSLTGLCNRRHIIDVANYQSEMRQQTEAPLSFILADIDFFKNINDKYGHEAGDSVLVAVSKAIRDSIREQDNASRWGGEEFLIVLPDTDMDNAHRVAQRIRQSVAAIAIPIDQQVMKVSITLGASCYRAGETIGEAIGRADQALYRGKKSGRNRVETAA